MTLDMAALHGIPVHDWSNPKIRDIIRERYWLPPDFDLAYDEMFISRDAASILAGEAAHFLWRMRVAAENEAVRKVALAHIEAAYQRILGEPHPRSE
jgi:hypothetical protein